MLGSLSSGAVTGGDLASAGFREGSRLLRLRRQDDPSLDQGRPGNMARAPPSLIGSSVVDHHHDGEDSEEEDGRRRRLEAFGGLPNEVHDEAVGDEDQEVYRRGYLTRYEGHCNTQGTKNVSG